MRLPVSLVSRGRRAGLRTCFDELVVLSDTEPEPTPEQRMGQETERNLLSYAKSSISAIEYGKILHYTNSFLFGCLSPGSVIDAGGM
jgi:hypothetical protein